MAGLVEPLTPRELEDLRLLAAGKRNREIASKLVVALDTVKTHVSHVLEKLGATNRAQAIAHAHELGLLRSSHDSVQPPQVPVRPDRCLTCQGGAGPARQVLIGTPPVDEVP